MFKTRKLRRQITGWNSASESSLVSSKLIMQIVQCYSAFPSPCNAEAFFKNADVQSGQRIRYAHAAGAGQVSYENGDPPKWGPRVPIFI